MENIDPLKTLKRPISLIGIMGSGKSTFGPLLAEALGRDFYDSDLTIEAKTGKSVASIFRDEGEAVFRRLERETIEDILLLHPDASPCVLATGGGAVTIPGTADLIFRHSLTIWIDSPVPTLVERIGQDVSRPLLSGGDPSEILSSLMEKRASLYARATLRVENDSISISELTERTLRQIEEYVLKQTCHETRD